MGVGAFWAQRTAYAKALRWVKAWCTWGTKIHWGKAKEGESDIIRGEKAGRDQNMQREWEDTSHSCRLRGDCLACTMVVNLPEAGRIALSLATQSVVPNQQHWSHQGACEECRISGPLSTYSIRTHILIRLPGDSHTQWSSRIAAINHLSFFGQT